MVRLTPAIAPTVRLNPFASPIVAAQVPVDFVFTGSATSPQAADPAGAVQGREWPSRARVKRERRQRERRLVAVEDHAAAAADLARQGHTLTIRATDNSGPTANLEEFEVQPQTPIVISPGAKTTLSGAPTTSSITSWTRLEPQCTDADMGTSSSARVFDPLWMLTRQWQMGEFQAEDAGTPIQARVRATSAMLTRRYSGELPKPAAGPTAIAAPAYDPTRTPLEVLVERRRMRAADANDARMLTFAVEAGLHFLRMLELQSLSKSYRAALLTRLALQQLPPATSRASTTRRHVTCSPWSGRAPDGRQLAAILRTGGAAQLVLDPALNIARRRSSQSSAGGERMARLVRLDVQRASGLDRGCMESAAPRVCAVGGHAAVGQCTGRHHVFGDRDRRPNRLEHLRRQHEASLTTTTDQSFTSLVETTIPAPVSFPGAPAPRFWEMEDARLAYGLVPVGPTDLAHLMMIEYASSLR